MAGTSSASVRGAEQGCGSIAEFYRGRSVFITGATGFMGKVLVEKLLRSCPDIECLYLLVRPSKGKDVSARLKELTSSPVFETLRRERPDILSSKLVAITGDILEPDLGLSLPDLHKLIDNVSVVFHSAARIKFDDDLRSALDSNVKAPQKLVVLCRQLKHLQAFVHVSTVYNNLDKEEIEEIVYPATFDPEKLTEIVDCMNDQLLASITKQLVGTCPNVYAFTKALGEQLLEKQCSLHDIPLVIVRPSIVTAAMKEPLPGWIDNLNGPSGLVAGVGKGFMRTVHVNPDLVGDLVPVDIPINLMIAAAWNRTVSNEKGTQVFNCSSGSLNPLTWKNFCDYGLPVWKKYPTREMLWYPSANLCLNPLTYKMEVALYHYIPAYFYDLFLRLIGKRPFLVRLYDKAHRATSCLDFYMMRQWNFVSRNPLKLQEKMSAEDRRVFFFDVREINWKDYAETYVRGARRFLLRDDPNTLPAARRNLRRLYLLRAFLRLVIVGVLVLLFHWILRQSNIFAGFLYQLDQAGSHDGIVLGHMAIDHVIPKI